MIKLDNLLGIRTIGGFVVLFTASWVANLASGVGINQAMKRPAA
ncbi:MAG: hypothetical protein WBB22_05630 [Anaerolineae bacterium]